MRDIMYYKHAPPRLIFFLCLWVVFTLPQPGWATSRGALYISTQPAGAQIYVDSAYEPSDTTPSLLTNLTAGSHNLKLSLSGYADVEVVVTVDADKVKDLRYTLNSQFGNLYIETSPTGAEVWLAGEQAGTSPLTLTHLMATNQQIHVKLKGYKPWFKQVKIEPNKTKHIEVKLTPQALPPKKPNAHPTILDGDSHKPKETCGAECHNPQISTGELKLESNPNAAHVWLDEELKGRTPLTLRLFPGDYTVKLTKPGYAERQQRVQITPNKQSNINFLLEYQYDIEDMIYIKGAEFIMVSNDGEPDESPAHKIQLETFYVDKYEVTNARYRRFLSLTKQRRRSSYTYDPVLGKDRQPVIGIAWDDAHDFCKWAGMRLPTEAEWELAARGSAGFVYPWGYKWNSECANSVETGLQRPVEGGNYPLGKSPYGALDMAGNVWEWCNDYYDKSFYTQSPSHNPQGPPEGKLRVLRGGSWFDGPTDLRVTKRRGENPKMRLSNIGFRCAKDADF